MIALDTNLLVYAHRAGVPEHANARAAIESVVRHPTGWGIALPCLTEFWAVVTYPLCAGGPSSPDQAEAFLRDLLMDGGGRVWNPGADFGLRILQMASRLQVSGPRIFDLHIGLIAFEGGATEMWSHDRNFVTVPGLKLVDPLT